MANMTFSLDAHTKKRFVEFCDNVGLSASSVITVYIKTVVRLFNVLGEPIDGGEELPAENHDHPLIGNWVNHRECHIAPNWLLIYQIHEGILILELTRTGSHSDLFQ